GVGHHQHAPVGGSSQTEGASLDRRAREVGAIQRVGSAKIVTAASKGTPCFSALTAAFRGSHSNTDSVYTQCGMLADDGQEAVTPWHNRVHRSGRRYPHECSRCPTSSRRRAPCLRVSRRPAVSARPTTQSENSSRGIVPSHG